MILYLRKNLLKESVSGDSVIDAINNRRGVLIKYHGENNTHTGARYIEPYVYGLTTANNPAIRAYQYYGDTKRGVPQWKLLRLDRIESWEPTDNTFDLEPQARGWAAEAFNGNDKLLPTIYSTVELGAAPQTDLERLRARTKQLKQSKPINIDTINKMNQANGTSTQTSKEKQSGPIGNNTPTIGTKEPTAQPKAVQSYQALNTDGTPKMKQDQPPVKQEPKTSGPVVQDTPMTQNQFADAIKNTPSEVTNNEEEPQNKSK